MDPLTLENKNKNSDLAAYRPMLLPILVTISLFSTTV